MRAMVGGRRRAWMQGAARQSRGRGVGGRGEREIEGERGGVGERRELVGVSGWGRRERGEGGWEREREEAEGEGGGIGSGRRGEKRAEGGGDGERTGRGEGKEVMGKMDWEGGDMVQAKGVGKGGEPRRPSSPPPTRPFPLHSGEDARCAECTAASPVSAT